MMVANQLLSDILSPLRTSDTGEQALTMMNLYHVRHLPIVNNEELLGTISEEDILDHDLNESIGSYRLSLFKAFGKDSDHLFELMTIMAKNQLTVLPIVDDKHHYLGLVSEEELFQIFAKEYAFTETGSILVIKTTRYNYSMSEIARCIESEGGTILSSFISSDSHPENLYITIKTNLIDTSRTISSLERFGYKIEAFFGETHQDDDLRNRYESLMKYLDV